MTFEYVKIKDGLVNIVNATIDLLTVNSLTVNTSMYAPTAHADTQTAGRFALTTGVWDDTQQSAIALRDVGANVPALTQVGTTGIYLPLFDVDDQAVFSVQFPHTLKEELFVTVYPHVHWLSSTDSFDMVRWEMTYQWVNNNSEYLQAVSPVITCDGRPIANQVQITSFPSIYKENAHISSIITGRLRRITNDATDYAGDVFLAFFDIHFQCDTLGSDAEGSKSYPS